MPLKLGAQFVALGVVLGLLGLLVWKIVNQEKSTIPQQVAANKQPRAPNFDLPRLDTVRDPVPLLAEGEGGRAQLLGLVVRPLPRRGA